MKNNTHIEYYIVYVSFILCPCFKKKKNTLVSVTKQDRKSEALPLRAAYI